MNTQRDVLSHQIRRLVIARPLFFIPLLALFTLFHFQSIQNTPTLYVLYALMGVTGGLTLLYLFLIPRTKPMGALAAQLAGDLFLITLLTGITGHVESPFSILYIANIVLSTYFFPQRGYLFATAAILLLGGIAFITESSFASVAGSLFGQIRLPPPRQETLYRFLLHVVAFYSTAIASRHFFNKMYEKEVGFSKLRLLHEDIVRNIPSGLVMTDLEGRIALFNNAASQIMGIPLKEALGSVWWELFCWKELQQAYGHLAASGQVQRFEGLLKKQNGEECAIGVTLSSLCNDQDDIVGVIGIFNDLTSIKRMEEEMYQRRRLAALGEMAAGIAHEIRNPLASISGAVQLLKDEHIVREDHQQLMKIALDEAQRLNNIITEFILYARPSPPRRQWVNMDALISETVELFKNRDPRIPIDHTLPHASISLFIDSDQMKQVFWNLAINAFQSMPHGGRLTIQSHIVHEKQKDGPGVEICFSDTGSGISPEDRPKIFDPFFSTKGTGSGMGLPIVQRIIEQHAGRIEVESTPMGTTFRIYLPQGRLHEASANSVG